MTDLFGRAAFSDAEAFTNFLEALKIAETSAKQIAFYRGRPEWLKVQNALEAVRETSTKLAMVTFR